MSVLRGTGVDVSLQLDKALKYCDYVRESLEQFGREGRGKVDDVYLWMLADVGNLIHEIDKQLYPNRDDGLAGGLLEIKAD